MNESNVSHWGKWIERRMSVVGFRRKADIAKAIGCVPHQLSRWLDFASPPTSMRKGFDVLLARALKTDRHTLFTQFANVTPDAATIIEEAPEHPADDVRAEIRSALQSMNVNALHIVQATVHAIVETAHAA